MEAFFLLPVASSFADSSSSSVSESGVSVCVGDTDGDGVWVELTMVPSSWDFSGMVAWLGLGPGTGAGSLWCPPQRQWWQQQKQQQQKSGHEVVSLPCATW